MGHCCVTLGNLARGVGICPRNRSAAQQIFGVVHAFEQIIVVHVAKLLNGGEQSLFAAAHVGVVNRQADRVANRLAIRILARFSADLYFNRD